MLFDNARRIAQTFPIFQTDALARRLLNSRNAAWGVAREAGEVAPPSAYCKWRSYGRMARGFAELGGRRALYSPYSDTVAEYLRHRGDIQLILNVQMASGEGGIKDLIRNTTNSSRRVNSDDDVPKEWGRLPHHRDSGRSPPTVWAVWK